MTASDAALALLLGAASLNTAMSVRLLGHDEGYVADVAGPPERVDKSATGETWYYPNLCVELESGLVRSTCTWEKDRARVCYYDAAKPKPSAPCRRWPIGD